MEFEKSGKEFSGNEEKSRLVFKLHTENDYQVNDLLEATDLAESTYHYWKARFDRDDPNQKTKEEIEKILEKNKDYGYRRVKPKLEDVGIKIGEDKTRRLMKEMGCQCTTYSKKSGKYSSYKGEVGKIAPNRINRRFYTSVPHQKITTDTTEFKYYPIDSSGNVRVKKLYLDPFLDMYNSEIITFRITKQPTGATIMAGLKEAIEKTMDCEFRRTFHSDQGWAYQMNNYVDTLKKNKIFQSMSRKGNCLDNSPMENFFSLLKQEIYYGRIYRSYEELEAAIHTFITYYNNHRIKEKLEYLSPVEYRLKEAAMKDLKLTAA